MRCPASLPLLAALTLAHPPAYGANVDLAAVLAANSHELSLEDGELTGAGAAFLGSAAHGAQFVALGEEHNNIDIPPLTTALFALLQRAEGFQYLALEQDPVMMQRVSRPPARGNDTEIRVLAQRYLMGFTFDSDQELAMLAAFGKLSHGRGSPIWGCDQAFGVSHILDELLPFTSGAGRAEVEALRLQALEAEATRDFGKPTFMQSAAVVAAIPGLRAALPAAQAARPAFLVDTLARSSEIYGYYFAGDRGELPGYYANNAVREDYMKERFLSEYRLAEARDRRPPKVLMKFGGYHLYRGLSPTSVPSLGNFVNDLARAHDAGFFSILVVPYGSDAGYLPFASGERGRFLGPFAALAHGTHWTLVDLRPLREYSYYRALRTSVPDLSEDNREELHRLVYGYDALLLLGGSAPATHEATHVAY